MRVLLIEDSTDIVDIVAVTLKLRWPEIELISSSLGRTGAELVKQEQPDIVLLDLGLPDTDGFQVLRAIREVSNVPVVILTVREEETDKIRGLEMGADDYIVKPFSPGELLARLRALQRRYQATETPARVDGKPPTPSIRGKLRIDFASEQVNIGDRLLRLGPREYELLYHLAVNEGRVVSNEALLEKVFPEHKDDIRFLEVYMKKLVEELEINPDRPEVIVKECTGYKFIR